MATWEQYRAELCRRFMKDEQSLSEVLDSAHEAGVLDGSDNPDDWGDYETWLDDNEDES